MYIIIFEFINIYICVSISVYIIKQLKHELKKTMSNPNAFLHPQKAFVDKGWAFKVRSLRRFPEVGNL